MGQKLYDGGILSSNLATRSGATKDYAQMYNDTRLHIGQIVEVIPISADRNRSKRFVEYDILVNDGGISASRYRNCRAMDVFASENNFQEYIYQHVTEGKKGKKDDAEAYQYKNGAIVLLLSVEGQKEAAVIIGGIQHPNIRGEDTSPKAVPEFSGIGSSTSRDSRLIGLPTLFPGDLDINEKRILGEYNGIRWNINNQGELTIVFQGIKNRNRQLSFPEKQPTIVKINEDGEIFFLDRFDQEIKISPINQKILISSGNEDPDFIEIDRQNKNITIDMGNNEIHKIDNDRLVNIGNNQLENIKEDSITNISGFKNTNISKSRVDKITKDHITKQGGKYKQTVGRTWTVNANGPARLRSSVSVGIIAPAVFIANQLDTYFAATDLKLGGHLASEPIILGNTFKDLYNDLINKYNDLVVLFNAHVHSGVQTGGGISGATTTPDGETTDNMTNTELSDIVKTEKTSSGIRPGDIEDLD